MLEKCQGQGPKVSFHVWAYLATIVHLSEQIICSSGQESSLLQFSSLEHFSSQPNRKRHTFDPALILPKNYQLMHFRTEHIYLTASNFGLFDDVKMREHRLA